MYAGMSNNNFTININNVTNATLSNKKKFNDDDDELDNFYSAMLWKLHLKGALQRLYKGYTK